MAHFYCPFCWKELDEDLPQCPYCGGEIHGFWKSKSYLEKLIVCPRPSRRIDGDAGGMASAALGDRRAVEPLKRLLDRLRHLPAHAGLANTGRTGRIHPIGETDDEEDRSDSSVGNPGFPRESHREGSRHPGQRDHGVAPPCHRCFNGRKRGPGTPRRRQEAVRRQGRAQGRGERQPDHRSEARRHGPGTAGRDRPTNDRPGRDAHEEQARGQRDPGRLDGGCPRGGDGC